MNQQQWNDYLEHRKTTRQLGAGAPVESTNDTNGDLGKLKQTGENPVVAAKDKGERK